MSLLVDSARDRLSAALLLTKNKGRDTIIKKNVKPEGSVPPWKIRGTYTLKKIKINQTIREKKYTFEITAAFCNECGGEMGIPGLMDYNIKEIDEQYRKAEEIITHKEAPWLDARKGFLPDETSHAEISLDVMKSYFKKVDEKYNIRTEEGLRKYISKMV